MLTAQHNLQYIPLKKNQISAYVLELLSFTSKSTATGKKNNYLLHW